MRSTSCNPRGRRLHRFRASGRVLPVGVSALRADGGATVCQANGPNSGGARLGPNREACAEAPLLGEAAWNLIDEGSSVLALTCRSRLPMA